MKKAVSIILISVILISLTFAGAFPASADTNNKMSKELESLLNDESYTGDIMTTLELSIIKPWTNEEKEQMIYEECGLTKNTCSVNTADYPDPMEKGKKELENYQLYHKTNIQITGRLNTENTELCLSALNLTKDDFKYVSIFTPICFGISLSKADILSLLESEYISYIDIYYDDTQYTDHPTESSIAYKDLFIKQFSEYVSTSSEFYYNELYYNLSDKQEVNWVLVKAMISECPWEYWTYGTIDNAVILGDTADNFPWSTSFGIFNPEDGKFYDLKDVNNYTNEIRDVMLKLKLARLIGDVDDDGDVTVADATLIQQCLAKIKEFPETDKVDEIRQLCFGRKISYFSDFDENGYRDLADATKIQMKLAKLI